MRVRVLTQIALFNLFWEKFWPRLLPPAAISGLFLAIALLDLLPILPFWLHIAALAGFLGFLGYGIHGLITADYRVLATEARRRLEIDSGISHRPFEALDDNPVLVGTDSDTEYIWQAHMVRMAAELKQLKVGVPSPGMAQRDPFGLRFILLPVLIIAGATGIGDARARLERALIPEKDVYEEVGLSINFWITPPVYTGLPPIFIENLVSKKLVLDDDPVTKLAATQPSVLRVPVGSSFLGQSNSVKNQATILIGERKVPFKPLNPNNFSSGFRVEGGITKSDVGAKRLEVDVGGRLAGAWPIQIQVDQTPNVEFTQLPKKQGRGVLRIEFEAQDDFGVSDLGLIIRNPQGRYFPDDSSELRVDLPTPGFGTPQIQDAISQDFADHPWAGMQVSLTLVATDTTGQEGRSETVSIILPERIFNHPVARAIISARKALNTAKRRVYLDVVRKIEEISERPDYFFGDIVVFLNLAVSRARLLYQRSPESIAGVQQLLWKTAIRIEDGEFVTADRDLEGVQRQLLEAFRNSDMSRMELNRLMNKFQASMERYMHALVKRFKQDGFSNTLQQSAKKFMESGDLQRMLDQIRELTQTGSLEAAKQIFTRLNQMLDTLRHGARMARQQRGPSLGHKILQGLRELSSRQRKLLDETFRKIQRRKMLETRQPSFEIASQQQALRSELDALMRQLNKILGDLPSSMKEADNAMKGAEQSLARGDRRTAVSLQTNALENLRKAAEGLAEKFARRMPGQRGFSLGRQRQQWPGNRDPFGRRSGLEGASGEIGNGFVKIPDGKEIRRSREILDELRVRSNDLERSKIEREYIDRLMRQF